MRFAQTLRGFSLGVLATALLSTGARAEAGTAHAQAPDGVMLQVIEAFALSSGAQ